MEDKYRKMYEENRPSDELVQQTKRRMRMARGGNPQMKWIKAVGAVAAVVVVFGVSVNVSPAFAQAVEEIPVVGDIARVLTVRAFTQEGPDGTVSVEQPMVADDTAFAAKVNEQINKVVDDYLDQANENIEAHREAFLATGGTEEEFDAMDIQVNVDYEILSETQDRVSFVLRASESDISSGNEILYYNLDLASGKVLTLEDVLGADWVEKCNAAIREQMAQNTEVPYFTEEEGGFTTVDENTAFYIDADGEVVVVFPKYAVAPGAYGEQTFRVGA